jgi:hypothetical protein
MKVKPSDIEQYLNILDQTPRHIAQLCQDIEQERLSVSPESGGWSLLEILAHLRACDDVWSHTIFAMLALERPTLPRLHPKAWLNVTRYDTLDFATSLQVFSLKRAELLAVLKGLSLEQWGSKAMIGGRSHTVFSHVRRLALHEADHYEQMASTLE